MFPHKSAPRRKEKKLEVDGNAEPCSWAVFSSRILRKKSRRATLPAAWTASSGHFVLTVAATAAAATNAAAHGATGEQWGQHSFFPTKHRPSSSAVESPAEPLPSPGDCPELRRHHGLEGSGAERDQPVKTLHSVRFCPAAAGLRALSLGGGVPFLPRLQASPTTPRTKNRRERQPSSLRISSLVLSGHSPKAEPKAKPGLPFPPSLSEVGDSRSAQDRPAPSGSLLALWLVAFRGGASGRVATGVEEAEMCGSSGVDPSWLSGPGRFWKLYQVFWERLRSSYYTVLLIVFQL